MKDLGIEVSKIKTSS